MTTHQTAQPWLLIYPFSCYSRRQQKSPQGNFTSDSWPKLITKFIHRKFTKTYSSSILTRDVTSWKTENSPRVSGWLGTRPKKSQPVTLAAQNLWGKNKATCMHKTKNETVHLNCISTQLQTRYQMNAKRWLTVLEIVYETDDWINNLTDEIKKIRWMHEWKLMTSYCLKLQV